MSFIACIPVLQKVLGRRRGARTGENIGKGQLSTHAGAACETATLAGPDVKETSGEVRPVCAAGNSTTSGVTEVVRASAAIGGKRSFPESEKKRNVLARHNVEQTASLTASATPRRMDSRGETSSGDESFRSLPDESESDTADTNDRPMPVIAESQQTGTLTKRVSFSSPLVKDGSTHEYSKYYEPNTVHTRNAGDYTVIAFINPLSGGQVGNSLMVQLRTAIGEEFVFDLSKVKRAELHWKPEDDLVRFAGDEMVRVLVCGGDGTMAWMLSASDRVAEETETEKLGIITMPLGTGNDLARTFGWGSSHRVSRSLNKLIHKVRLLEFSC